MFSCKQSQEKLLSLIWALSSLPTLEETRIQHKRHPTDKIQLTTFWQLYGKRPINQSCISKFGELCLTQSGVQERLLYTSSRLMSAKLLFFPELEGCSEGYSPCGTRKLLLCKTCTTTKSGRKWSPSPTKLPLTILQTIIKPWAFTLKHENSLKSLEKNIFTTPKKNQPKNNKKPHKNQTKPTKQKNNHQPPHLNLIFKNQFE